MSLMTKLTPQELDERIKAMKAVYDITAHPDFVTDLKLIIRDFAKAVTPEFGEQDARYDSMYYLGYSHAYRQAVGSIQANTKRLLND